MVLYLEATRSWTGVPPIKNILVLLCKTIRNYSDNPWIFISNHIPRVGQSPIQYPVAHSYFTLQQAIRSVGRVLKGGVFELSLYEHFTCTKTGKTIWSRDQIFTDAQDLTLYGCLIFRECLIQEIGIKTYWFDKAVDQ